MQPSALPLMPAVMSKRLLILRQRFSLFIKSRRPKNSGNGLSSCDLVISRPWNTC